MKGQQGALLPCLLPGRPPGFETHAPYEVSRVQFVDPSLSHPSRWSRARWPPKCQKQGWASRPEFRVLALGLAADTRLLGKTRAALTFQQRGGAVKALSPKARPFCD